jgi:hypothetical protein
MELTCLGIYSYAVAYAIILRASHKRTVIHNSPPN